MSWFDVVVFTKKRPAQYDLLMRSIIVHWGGVAGHILSIYKKTTDKVDELYQAACGSEFLIEEKKSFSEMLIYALRVLPSDKVVMLADDNVVLRCPTQYEIEQAKKYECFSLRLHPMIDYCQPASKKITVPKLKNHPHHISWDVRETEKNLCWGYKNPIENVHDRKGLLKLCQRIGFMHSGDLECAMGQLYQTENTMASFLTPCLVNIPMNTILPTSNPSSGATVDDLIKKYDDGYRISYHDIVSGLAQNACHVEKEPKWVKRIP